LLDLVLFKTSKKEQLFHLRFKGDNRKITKKNKEKNISELWLKIWS